MTQLGLPSLIPQICRAIILSPRMAEEKTFTVTDLTIPEPDTKTVAIYSNYAALFSAPEEFIIRFCHKSLVEGQRPKELVRVYLSMAHAKRLMLSMSRVVQQYEAMFGEIKMQPQLTPEGEKLIADQKKKQGDASN